MTDVAALQSRIEKYADTASEYWKITHDGREFTLFCNPKQTQEWVLSHYPGAGVVRATGP